jgi:hypothetical protein
MADNLITPTVILAETLRIVHNESAFLGSINTEYNDEFAKKGMKPGASVYPRKPVQFTVRDGAVANFQDVNEQTEAITIEPEFGIDWDFTDYDLTLNIDKFSERYLQPAGKRLAAELDLRIGSRFYKRISNFTGTPGTTPNTTAVLGNAMAYLDDLGVPRDSRILALSPFAMQGMVEATKGAFNDQKAVGDQYKTGRIKTHLGADYQMSPNMPRHTVGGLGGTPLVNGANQGITNASSTDNPYASTTALVTDGWTAAAANRLKAGDVITIGGVFAVNPETKQSLGYLKTFVVQSDVTSDGAGNATITVSPGIIAGGAYQNVTTRPADNAAITVLTGTATTTYPQNILYHKDSFTMVTVDMDVPRGMDMAEKMTVDGVNLRFVRGFDITNNKRLCRFDIMAGFGSLQRDWAIRISG